MRGSNATEQPKAARALLSRPKTARALLSRPKAARTAVFMGKGSEFMRKNSVKNTRVNAEVQRELGNIIRNGIKDPRVAPMTSVVAVQVAPDLKTCKAYISVFGDEQVQQDTIKGLKSAEGYIRRELARTVNMRNTPQIQFVLDQSIEYGVSMSKKIADVTKDLKTEEIEEEDE